MDQPVIISDFDGTLIEIDSVRYILETYVDGDWKAPDDLYNEGLISLEECLRQALHGLPRGSALKTTIYVL